MSKWEIYGKLIQFSKPLLHLTSINSYRDANLVTIKLRNFPYLIRVVNPQKRFPSLVQSSGVKPSNDLLWEWHYNSNLSFTTCHSTLQFKRPKIKKKINKLHCTISMGVLYFRKQSFALKQPVADTIWTKTGAEKSTEISKLSMPHWPS